MPYNIVAMHELCSIVVFVFTVFFILLPNQFVNFSMLALLFAKVMPLLHLHTL